MHAFRSPDIAFESLPDFPFQPHYLEWNGLRVHHLDEGPSGAPVMQDWGGPIGLRQVCDQPARFERVFILNTWLHHEGYEYSNGIRMWRQMAVNPDALGGDMPTGRIVAMSLRRDGHDRDALAAAYDAPYDGIESKAGARRFPYCIPFAEPEAGNAASQQWCFDTLPTLLPIHIAFGDADGVFTWEWAQQWHHQLPGSTLDRIEGAGHFPQEDATADCLEIVLRRATAS
jgi:haloalkane dehalogenase